VTANALPRKGNIDSRIETVTFGTRASRYLCGINLVVGLVANVYSAHYRVFWSVIDDGGGLTLKKGPYNS